MPEVAAAVASAITYVSSASAAVTAGSATLAQTLTVAAVNIAASAALNAASALLNPNVGVGGNPTDWVADPDAPLRYAIGRGGAAGQIVHRDEYGPDNMFQSIVAVIAAGGPIKSFVAWEFDDQPVTFNPVTGAATSSQWLNEMWVTTRRGLQPDTALTSPAGLKNGATLPGWTSASRLSGKAAYMLTMAENSKRSAFPTGEPKPLVTWEGCYGWDPRLDSTYPGGSGACRLNDPATWVWIDNPALGALKWATGLWEGPSSGGKYGVPHDSVLVGGFGSKVEGIDVASFVEAANIADANGWTVAAYPSSADNKAQVMDALLQAAGAIYAERAGKISCIHRAAPRASVVTISAADTAGPLELDTTVSRIGRINTIRPRYWSEQHRWQMTAADAVTASAYVAEDNGERRTRGVDFPFVRSVQQASELAALQLANTREGFRGVIPLKPHLQRIKPGDAFTITEPGFLLDGQKCLCLDTEFDAATGVHRVTFVSETDAKYDFAFGLTPEPPPPATLSPNPGPPNAPDIADWTIVPRPPGDGGVSLPGLELTGEVSNAAAHRVLVEYGPTNAGPWSQVYEGPPTTERVDVTVPSGGIYYVAITYFDRAGVPSDRTVFGPYTAPGLVADDVANIGGVPIDQIPQFDTTPPAAPAGLTLASTSVSDAAGNPYVRITASWTAPGDPDVASYELEVTDGGVTVVYPVATTSWLREAVTGRVYAIRVRALDRAGNRSAWTAPSNVTGAGDSTAPNSPSGLSVTPSLGAFHLSWTNPTATDTARVDVWEHTINNSAAATRIASVQAAPGGSGAYARTGLGPGATRWYWLRAIDTSGNASGFSSGVSATIPSVTLTDFASSIRPVELMTTAERTAATPTAGRQVFDTTLNRLFRGTGTGWDATVPATDVTGQLTAAQLEAIEAAKVTGQIVGTQISDSAVTTAKIAAGAITAGKIAAGAITAGDIAANAVTATQIAAGAVTTAKIAAGAVTADQIAADTITAGNIAAGAVTASELAANAVTADKIGAGAVTAGKIAAGSITADRLSVVSLAAISAALGTVTSGRVQNAGNTAFLDLNASRQQFTVGSYVWRQGAIGSGVIAWFGPSSIAIGSETRTNGVFALGTDGQVYFGAAAYDGTLASRASTLEAQMGGSTDSGLRSRIATEETTRASADSALASRASTLEALAVSVPNLLLNSDASEGLRFWAETDGFQSLIDPNLGYYFGIGSTANNRFLISDQLPCYPNSPYRFSFEGDAGAGANGCRVWVTEYNSSGVLLRDFLGDTNFSGAGWGASRKTGVAFTTGANAARLVVVVFKPSSAPYCNISRIMFHAGHTPARWNNDRAPANLSARIATEETVRASADSALALGQSTLSASLGTLTSTVNTQAGAITTLQGRTQAWWQNTTQAGEAATLIRAQSDAAAGSSIMMVADKMGIATSVGGVVKELARFEADKIRLGTDVAISGDLLVDGAITNAKISASAVTRVNTVVVNTPQAIPPGSARTVVAEADILDSQLRNGTVVVQFDASVRMRGNNFRKVFADLELLGTTGVWTPMFVERAIDVTDLDDRYVGPISLTTADNFIAIAGLTQKVRARIWTDMTTGGTPIANSCIYAALTVTTLKA